MTTDPEAADPMCADPMCADLISAGPTTAGTTGAKPVLTAHPNHRPPPTFRSYRLTGADGGKPADPDPCGAGPAGTPGAPAVHGGAPPGQPVPSPRLPRGAVDGVRVRSTRLRSRWGAR